MIYASRFSPELTALHRELGDLHNKQGVLENILQSEYGTCAANVSP